VFQDEGNAGALAIAAIKRDEGATKPSDAIALEIDDLADTGVIGVQVEGSDLIARPGELYGSSGRASNKPFQDLKPTTIGQTMHRLMRLDSIQAEDRERFLAELAEPAY
jgi:hypothetical protein